MSLCVTALFAYISKNFRVSRKSANKRRVIPREGTVGLVTAKKGTYLFKFKDCAK